MKIVEMYAQKWLEEHNDLSKTGKELVMDFAREVQRLMGIEEEAKDES